MKAIGLQEKIITESIRLAKNLIKKNIPVDFNLLINENGDLTYVDPFFSEVRSNEYWYSDSQFTRASRYCQFQLFLENYSDYVNIFFQNNVVVQSRNYKNTIIVSGNLETQEDFGYHVIPYMISRKGQLLILKPKKFEFYEFDYLIKNEVLEMLSEYTFDN
jgi:hypothetical protein